MKKFVLIIFCALALMASTTPAFAWSVIDFDSLAAGTIVDNEFVGLGLSISARNYNRSHDEAIIFDSNNPTGGDSDLGFGSLDLLDGDWSGGNIETVQLNNLLIIAEDIVDTKNNQTGAAGADGLVDDPDDEGGRPAGWIKFEWDDPISKFGFDFVDVDGGGEDPANYKAIFYSDGVNIGERTFAQYAALDSTIVHGNNFANRYAPITSADLGGTFDKVKIKFAGSGAIDNIVYHSAVPEPATMLLFSTGLVGAYFRRRNA